MKMEEAGFKDADLEAILGLYNIDQPEGLKCDNAKTIQRMCINPKCEEVSLVCSDISCQQCSKCHIECSQVKLLGVASRLKKRAEKQKDFILNICQIQNAFIHQLQNTRKPLTEKYYFGSIEDKYLQIIRKIYTDKEFKFLKGKEAEEFWKRLQLPGNVENGGLSASLLDSYQKIFSKFLEEAVALKNKIFESFSSEKEACHSKELEIDSNILSNPLKTKLEEFNASILLGELKSEQLSFLKDILNSPARIQKLFRASEHGFKAAAFHEKCNNQIDTLVLVRTEFGKTIGGFTHYPWLPGNAGFTKDAGRRAFVFSVDMKEKFVPQGDDYLIYNHDSYGPWFGGGNGYDIRIYDDCSNTRNSHGNFPQAYNRAGGDKLQNNQDSYRMFSGATSGYCYRVVEYEVFKVWYQ